MAVTACRIFDEIDWNSSNGMPSAFEPLLIRSQPFSTLRRASRLASASHIVLLSPSKGDAKDLLLQKPLALLVKKFLERNCVQFVLIFAGNTS